MNNGKPTCLWNTRTPQYTKETIDFLKTLMTEAKISNQIRRDIQRNVQSNTNVFFGLIKQMASLFLLNFPEVSRITPENQVIQWKEDKVGLDCGREKRLLRAAHMICRSQSLFPVI
nr:unnamed protein product [Spirometra erinaceieuropaei]